MEKKTKWGTPQHWGTLTIKYKPTGEVKKLKLGIRRMNYNNELIFCECWGYDKGSPTDLNNPDNYEVIDVSPSPSSNETLSDSAKATSKVCPPHKRGLLQSGRKPIYGCVKCYLPEDEWEDKPSDNA